MPTLEEMLNEIDNSPSLYELTNDVFTIDPETRVINVPTTESLFGVESDEKTERKYFQCPKIVGDNIDLSTMGLRINYENAIGYKNSYPVTDVTVKGENITFSWLLGRDVTAYAGTIRFIVCATKTNDDGTITNEWNTTIAEGTSIIGLEVEEQATEEEQTLIEQLIAQSLQKITEMNNLMSESEAKVNEAVRNANTSASNADEKAQEAETAAENANEAAQQVFDEAYILTAETTFNKEATITPTAYGNALIEQIEGDTWQQESNGYQLFDASKLPTSTSEDITVTNNGDGSFTVNGIEGTTRIYVLETSYTHEETLQMLKTGEIHLIQNGDTIPYAHVQLVRTGGTQTWFVLDKNRKTSTITEEMLNDSNCRLQCYIYSNTSSKVKNGTIKPMLYQDGTGEWEPFTGVKPAPSPEYPQHIYGLGDTGYFDGELVQGDIFSSGANDSSSSGVKSMNYIPCNQSDLINVIYENKCDYIAIAFYDDGYNFISRSISSGGVMNAQSFSANAPSNSKYFKINIQSYSEGSSSYITPQTAGHIAVTINGKYAVKVDCVGKNLIEYPYLYSNTTVYGVTLSAFDDGSYSLNGNSTGNSVIPLQQDCTDENNFKIILQLEAGKKYFAKDVQVFIMNNGISSAIKAMDSQQIYTAKEGDLIAGFRASIADGETYSSNRIYYPIFCEYEEGMNTDYIPYQHSLSYLPISSPLYEGDSIVKINGVYKIRRVNGVAVFDGSEDEVWKEYTTGILGGISFYNTNETTDTKVGYQASKCDKFMNVNTAWDKSGYGIYSDHHTQTYKYFRQPNEEVHTLEQWKTWLQSNPITLVYKLATPVYEDIDQDQFYSIMAADELTNVSLLGENDNLELNNKVRFPRHTDGAIATTGFAEAKKNSILLEEQTQTLEQRIQTLETLTLEGE